ncbi:hypothetical protein [Paraclostridium sordellii]|uniref:hypothetical protein n=1 Tax=Paraclostridium sordellii TaxID=1505 RepID=UPI000E4CDEC5|nr:hypothetical protein [Paeniclostridium sordellii]RGW97767.1 hypothetical protein DWV40_16515 [Paeniclostridium sordellii]
MKNIMKVNELQEIVLSLEKFKVSEIEGKIILGYFESHDYEIMINKKLLFVRDIQDETDIVQENFEEIVYRVREWNESIINNVENEIENLYATLEQHNEYEKLMMYLTSLREDEKILENLYKSLIERKNKYILYVNNNGKYEVNKFDKLEKGHKAFNDRRKIGNFDYLELGIDKVDEEDKYIIVRKLYA